ncbi:MAG: carboxymuconolactone decarboxylase family protein [Bacteroidota bacterium]|jgi:alkylhydroperoxidase family enzyme|nr:MAG: carboxymuconolactone decarboxylase family protein [Bacteroidota bacterium]
METRLAPIENPTGFLMKLVYWFSKKQFGKVITPLKVIYARLPISFASFTQRLPKLESKYQISKHLALLIRTHVAQLNTCHFCIDIGKAEAMKAFPDQLDKFLSVSRFRELPSFSASERAALQFAEELTLNKKVSDETFEEVSSYFTERQIVEIAWAVTHEHIYNLMNGAFNVGSDGLCQLPDTAPAKRAEAATVAYR